MKNNILAIGIDKYKSINQLSNCVKDIENILDVLLEKYDFENENILKLYNEDATQSNIISSLEDLLYRQNNGENLIIFYSGHGEFDKNLDLGYFLPFETEIYKKHTYIPNTSIFNYIKSLEYRHTLIISDSCFSGSLFENTRFTKDLPEKLYEIPSKWALTSGRLEKVSDGIPGTNSPFTNSLLNRLKDFDGNSFAISELTNYVISDVAQTNSQLPWGSPLSKYGDKGGQFSFKIKNKSQNKYDFKSDFQTNNYNELFNEYYDFYEKFEDSENKNNVATSRRLKEELDLIKKEINKEIVKELEINKNLINNRDKLIQITGQDATENYDELIKIRTQKNYAVKLQKYAEAANLRDQEKKLEKKLEIIILDNKKIISQSLFIDEENLIQDFSLFSVIFDMFNLKSKIDKLETEFLNFYFLKLSCDLNKITKRRFNHIKELFYEQIRNMIENNFQSSEESNSIASLSSLDEITPQVLEERYGIRAAAAKYEGGFKIGNEKKRK